MQYFELLGDRALWHDGWKAVARHVEGRRSSTPTAGSSTTSTEDFSECDDLAAPRAREAPRTGGSLVGRGRRLSASCRSTTANTSGWPPTPRPGRASRYIYYPGMARIDRLSAPYITDRSWTITAEVEIPAGGAEGVLLAAGSRFAGYALYVKEGRLVYEYVYAPAVRHAIRSEAAVSAGARVLRYEFRRTGPRRGRGTLSVDGRAVGSVEIPKTWPVHGTTAGVTCGHDTGASVSDAYAAPFPFTGTLRRVIVELGDEGAGDPSGESRGALGEE